MCTRKAARRRRRTISRACVESIAIPMRVSGARRSSTTSSMHVALGKDHAEAMFRESRGRQRPTAFNDLETDMSTLDTRIALFDTPVVAREAPMETHDSCVTIYDAARAIHDARLEIHAACLTTHGSMHAIRLA